MDAIPVVVVDDDYFFRKGLCAEIERPGTPPLQLVGQADNTTDGLRLVETYQPAVLITDLKLEPVSQNKDVFQAGIEFIQQTQTSSPDTRILAITGYDERPDVQIRAIRIGVRGYIMKSDLDMLRIRDAIVTLHEGGLFHSQKALQYLHQMIQLDQLNWPIEPFTPREEEVLQLVTQGWSNQQIADALTISIKTVKTHVSNILSKLQFKDRTEAVMYYRIMRGNSSPNL